jgi:capsular polysaccharide biosynthesis protein
LSNELEVIAYLEGEGYETIYAEQLSFVEQVRLFQSASSIIAANGSALQNLIFSDVSVNVFVLASSNLHNWGTFYGMMSALGYQSTFVCGEAVGDPSEKHADYVVPIATLEDALARRAK